MNEDDSYFVTSLTLPSSYKEAVKNKDFNLSKFVKNALEFKNSKKYRYLSIFFPILGYIMMITVPFTVFLPPQLAFGVIAIFDLVAGVVFFLVGVGLFFDISKLEGKK